MRFIEVELYSIEELRQTNPEGYKNALEQYARTLNTDFILCDAMTTIGTCLHLFGYRPKILQLDISKPIKWPNPIIYILPISIKDEEEEGQPLDKKGEDLMKLFSENFDFATNPHWRPTGSPYDLHFGNVIIGYHRNQNDADKTLRRLLNDCCIAVLEAAHNDHNNARIEEAFLKFCKENDAEFYFDGDIW